MQLLHETFMIPHQLYMASNLLKHLENMVPYRPNIFSSTLSLVVVTLLSIKYLLMFTYCLNKLVADGFLVTPRREKTILIQFAWINIHK